MCFELLRCKFKKDNAPGIGLLGCGCSYSTRASKNGKTKGYCDKDLLVSPASTATG